MNTMNSITFENKIYNFLHMAKCMSIDEFHDLPEEVQDRYLSWSKAQFEFERAAILLKRAGGLSGVAKTMAMKEVTALEMSFANYWIESFRSKCRRSYRSSDSLSSMTTSSSDVQEY